jgi:hypothetical protein
MAGYVGTQMQQHLQAQAEASDGLIRATPGLCQTGRGMGCDDPDRLGWDRINEFLSRDGMCGFRLIPAAMADELKARLSRQDCRFDSWNVFLADRATALRASEAIVARGLSHGCLELASPAEPDADYTRRIQTLMVGAGVVPFSGSLLTGAFGPVATVAVGDESGDVVAAAHGYLPHNVYSDYRRHAWGGLVAVAESQRGKGLGNYINACMIVAVFRDLDATHIYELVSATNIPSRRMVESCGLRPEPALICGIATPNRTARFTR